MIDKPLFLIGGEFTDQSEHPSFPVVNPCTEENLWDCPQAGPSHVAEAVKHAKAAQSAWADTHPSARATLLRKTADILASRVEAIGKALSLEVGRPYKMAVGEPTRGVEILHWIAGEADRIGGETLTSRAGGRISIVREPVGIVAGITPWNFPVGQALQKLGPALAAGCPIILRPAEIAPLTATLLVQCFVDAGFPKGVIQMLHGAPQPISDAIFDNPDIRKVAFTGSTAVGKMLLAKAAASVKRTSMELGGHSPVIVCADADLDNAAAQTAMLKFANSGQVCIAPTRFYVHEDVAEAFTQKLVAQAEARVLGDSQNPDSTMGPLAHAGQRAKLEELIADAIAKGATVRTGGARPAGLDVGYFLEPTVLADVPADARIMHEEPFGPVALITTFSDLDEAIARANDSEYGLASYGFTTDLATSEKLSRGLQAGVIAINNIDVSGHESPFGGIKQSGIGREAGRYGILEYMNIKATHVTW
ncbi:NAD-dependent succinate-semialdehyde dehydrogenase [Cognatishimia sp. SS12]|uniref:NAD-dependent succinate-semialdehyde dehydrogenase n=1 Tax=Cognatishimia sp. SS12 TaxID=2979465 RepID=UPI00232F4552|nr:NAD-dependent succinate-semialdehyde dehydrogenase [Cognatishimia sp. SS12]MDC0739592.1 NAD-dependent succinate-semialdehyde dehydrogenase [Cognatishimia sp. SS12]